jgi:hypothetical protein
VLRDGRAHAVVTRAGLVRVLAPGSPLA